MTTVYSLQELLALKFPDRKELIENGLLLPGTGNIIVGSAKSWKSLLSMHLGYCLSTGKKWLGFRTSQCATYRYQLEMTLPDEVGRVKQYMSTLESTNGNLPKNMFFSTERYIKLNTGYGKKEMEKVVEIAVSRSPDKHLVLIIDPIYIAIAGRISDDYEVQKFLDNINDLRGKYNITVILVHHTRKIRVDSYGNIIDQGSEETMGSSYLMNWVDTMMRVRLLDPNTTKQRVELTFPLARHARKQLPNSIELMWDKKRLKPVVVKTDMETESMEVTGKELSD